MGDGSRRDGRTGLARSETSVWLLVLERGAVCHDCGNVRSRQSPGFVCEWPS